MRSAVRRGPFQSHAGSIEAPRLRHAAMERIARFNPTLVRLRLMAGRSQAAAGRVGFNPTLVRLRRKRRRSG